MEGQPLILRTRAGLIPSLKFDELINDLPKIVVDMGAVAHVVNGAQIMRPGIKQFGNDFAKGDLVVIVDREVWQENCTRTRRYGFSIHEVS